MKYRSLPGLFILLVVLLAALVACGKSAEAASGPQTVYVTYSHSTIRSSLTAFSAGTTYHFVVSNQSQVEHQFTIVPLGLAPSILNGNVFVTINSLAPGETRTVDYTFPLSAVGKSLEITCFLHLDDVGMLLPITVTS